MAEEKKIHDLVIIGAGPSALTAAIYTTREDIETLLVERGVVGGLAAITDWIDNYPGFAEGVAGLELSKQLRAQAERFGAKIMLGEVTGIADQGEYKQLTTTSGEDLYARAVLIATGTDHKKIGIPGEEEYYGRGVHYCATCDGAFYRDKKIVVVGGGNSAIQETLFLTRYASHIDILARSELKASDILIKDLEKHKDKVRVHLNTTTDEIVGENGKVVKVVGTKNGQKTEFSTDGVFVFIGLIPNTGFLKKSDIMLDEHGFIDSGSDLKTKITGVFASGDVRRGATMQIASASGEGASAALAIRQYLEGGEMDLYGNF